MARFGVVPASVIAEHGLLDASYYLGHVARVRRTTTTTVDGVVVAREVAEWNVEVDGVDDPRIRRWEVPS